MSPDPIDTFHEHIKAAIQAGISAEHYDVLMLASFRYDSRKELDLHLEKATEIANVMPSSYILLKFVQTVRESFAE